LKAAKLKGACQIPVNGLAQGCYVTVNRVVYSRIFMIHKAAKSSKTKALVKVLFILAILKRRPPCGTILAFGRPSKNYVMKRFFTLICAGLFLLLTAFTQANGVDGVMAALRGGNASELGKYMDDTVEIKLPSKAGSYSRSQAVVIMQDFFQNNGVRGFEEKFRGENGGTQFCIGTLQTRSGAYRTTFFVGNRNGKQMVKEIRFQNN
jgi:hypothetical protein